MHQMYIQCHTIAEMMEVVAAAVMQGLTFEADTSTLQVIFTGGY